MWCNAPWCVLQETGEEANSTAGTACNTQTHTWKGVWVWVSSMLNAPRCPATCACKGCVPEVAKLSVFTKRRVAHRTTGSRAGPVTC